MFEAELIAFGLRPREAKVYLTTLKLGEASASTIAKQCEVSRLTTYSILGRLLKMNLITCYENRRVRVFQALPPESFLNLCDEQMSSIQAKKERLQTVIPQLKHTFLNGKVTASSGRIRLIQDRTLFKNLCKSGFIQSPEWFALHDGSIWDLFSLVHHHAETSPRLLLPLSERRSISKHVQDLEVRYVPDARFQGPVNFFIIGTKVFFVLKDGEEFSAVEVDHASVAHMLRSFFLLLWEVDFFEG